MRDRLQSAFFAALTRIFKPIVRVALRRGVSFKACADVLKWCFVDVAMNEFAPQGKRNSKSRVAVISGITRIEVDRLLKTPEPQKGGVQERYHRATRVLTGWAENPRYQDENGDPLALTFDGECVSFSSLVYDHSGGTPARPVLDELIETKAVVEQSDGKLQLMRKFLIPASSDGDIQKLNILGVSAGDLLETIEHNIRPGQEQTRFQRVILNDALPISRIDEIRKATRERGQAMADEIDSELYEYAKSDKDAAPVRAGIGIYYFESPQEKGSSAPPAPAGKRNET